VPGFLANHEKFRGSEGPFGGGGLFRERVGPICLHVFGAIFKWRLIGQIAVRALLSGAAAAPVSAETVSY